LKEEKRERGKKRERKIFKKIEMLYIKELET